jgi:hypothetical protein
MMKVIADKSEGARFISSFSSKRIVVLSSRASFTLLGGDVSDKDGSSYLVTEYGEIWDLQKNVNTNSIMLVREDGGTIIKVLGAK